MVTDQNISDLLVACFEGGSNYWITSVEILGDEKGEFASDHVGNGGEVTINVFEDKPETLTRDKMRKGIQRAARDFHMNDRAFVEAHDADTADVALQLAVFDQVIYG